MSLNPINQSTRIKIHTANDLTRFIDSLEFRESFEIELIPLFSQAGWGGRGNIVWVEGRISPHDSVFHFFYDDGIAPEYDEHGEVLEETNEYPFITCSLSDIVSVKKIL